MDGLQLNLLRRTHLMLGDDPNFVPDYVLPPLDFDDNGGLVLPGLDVSPGPRLSSQLSPLDRHSGSFDPAPLINLDIRHSSSIGSVHIASAFDLSDTTKNQEGLFTMSFGEEEDLPFAEFPIRIDADGNLIEEPELPVHQSQQDKDGNAVQEDIAEADLVMLGDEDANVSHVGDESQHPGLGGDAQHEQTSPNNEKQLACEEPLVSASGGQELRSQPRPLQRRLRKPKILGPDATTQVGRSEFKAWTEDYLNRAQAADESSRQVTAAQARKNAYNFVFGQGLGGVGVLNGILGLDHELAQLFAGKNLEGIVMEAALVGGEGSDQEADEEEARIGGRRRPASSAFGSEPASDDANERRIRPRLGESEHDRDIRMADEAMKLFDDDQGLWPEVGREQPGSALSDHRRSSNAPWNRQPSMVPSSVRSGKNIEDVRDAVEQSPLIGRGSVLHSGVKFSDTGIPMFGSDGNAPCQSDGAHDPSSLGGGSDFDFAMLEASACQVSRDALDREGRNFLAFVERMAADRGHLDANSGRKRWLAFDRLFGTQDRTRTVVAHGFLHVLTLASKNQIRVKQDPLGEIYLGVMSNPQRHQEGTQLHDPEESDEWVGDAEE